MSLQLATVLGLASISFIFAFLSVNMDRERNGPLQFFFLIMSMYLMSSTLVTVSSLMRATDAGLANMIDGVYYIVLFSTLFVLGYFIIMLMAASFQGLFGPTANNIKKLVGIKKQKLKEEMG